MYDFAIKVCPYDELTVQLQEIPFVNIPDCDPTETVLPDCFQDLLTTTKDF